MTTLSKQEILDQLDERFSRYADAIGALAEDISEAIVVPLHKLHGWGFISGWGEWYFLIDGKAVNNNTLGHPIEIADISDILSLQLPGMPTACLGSMMPHIPERE